jgi:hypothetical protein
MQTICARRTCRHLDRKNPTSSKSSWAFRNHSLSLNFKLYIVAEECLYAGQCTRGRMLLVNDAVAGLAQRDQLLVIKPTTK